MSPEKPSKTFSCVRCFDRKVKCDKQQPCSGCVRSKVECVFRTPSAPRRKKKRSQEEMLLARLKHCEELLQRQGIDVDETSPTSRSSASASASGGRPTAPEVPYQTQAPHSRSQPAYTSGNLVIDQGKTRFLENNLWSSVSGEFEAKEAIADSSDEDDTETVVEDSGDFILGLTPLSPVGVQRLHPQPDQIVQLWRVFLENVDPMTKIIHRPSLQESILKASTNLESISKSLEALMFAIYSMTVFSMTDSECESTFEESRKLLLSRYRRGTRIALSRARFLGTSDVVVLQAFVFYLLSMREDYDARTVWTLAGVAGRIAQGMGLHRDGMTLGLPPFETELRRRLWWQITILDFRSAELSGSGRFGDLSVSNTLPPTNINDEDMWPGMKEPPVAQTRPTEIIACLLRCEFGSFWKEKLREKGASDAGHPKGIGFWGADKSPWDATLEERDRNIDQLKLRLEEKFLRYCDVSIPIQFMASIIGRGALISMRLMAHHPKRYRNDLDVPEEERKLLWDLSMQMLEGDNLVHSSRQLQKYMWHTNVYFQWHALIYILGELKMHTLGEQVDKAWFRVEEVFEHHPAFINESKKPLHVAVGSLCLKAYDARESALQQSGAFRPAKVPEFITALREQRQKAKSHVQQQQQRQQQQQPQPSIPQADLSATSHSIAEQETPFLQQQHEPSQHPMQQPLPQSQGWAETNFMPDWNNNYLAAGYFDPTLTPNLVHTDTNQMDWTQWDNLIQETDLGVNNYKYSA